MARDANAWIDREIAGCRFADERLSGRLRTLLAQMAGLQLPTSFYAESTSCRLRLDRAPLC
jgi:hypothetical protein